MDTRKCFPAMIIQELQQQRFFVDNLMLGVQIADVTTIVILRAK